MSASGPSRFTLVGAGAVASALGPLLVSQGWRALGVFGRTAQSVRARTLAGSIGGEASLALDESCQASELIVLAVSDSGIADVAHELADSEVDWPGKVVMHLSGALPAAVLAPLEMLGAHTLAAHPLQSFGPKAAPEVFQGIPVTLEGSESARRMIRPIFQQAGSQVLMVSPSDKVAIHAAASLVSNFTVTLAGMAQEVARSSSLSEIEVAGLFGPLLMGTARNIAEVGPGRALTGPIVRGDADTVQAHAHFLAEHTPHLMTAYVALATETVRLARSTARLTGSDAMRILDIALDALPIGPAVDDDEG